MKTHRTPAGPAGARSAGRVEAVGSAHNPRWQIGTIRTRGVANYGESVGGFEGVASVPWPKNTAGRARAQLVDRVQAAALLEAITAERKRRRAPTRRVAMSVLIQRFGGG